VALENGFPARARLVPNLGKERSAGLLAAPMFATLRRLDAADDAGAAVLVEAACSPRFVALTELTVRATEGFEAIAARGAPGRLRWLDLRFPATARTVEQLLHAPAFSALASLVAQLSGGSEARPAPRGRARRPPASTAPGDELGARLVALGQHASLEPVELLGLPWGTLDGFATVAAARPRLRFKRVCATGSFELSREDDGELLVLQNLSPAELRRARPLVPQGVTRARLMPARTRARDAELAEVRAAWADLVR
jgi:hypothetical protein